MGIVLPEISLEDALLARARRGDQAALAEIYERYFPAIYQFVRLRVEDRQVAEDISGEVFVTLIDAFGNRKGPRHSLRAWLFQVARNEIFAVYGKTRHFRTTTLDEWVSVTEDDMEVDFIRSLDAERARRALQMLAPEQQEVLLLRFGEGLSLQETADVMGKNVGAIKSLQFRAVDTLRQILGDMRVENYG
jgi:RNA polymerase sigma-70 factor (ECF subfamily)